MLWIKAAHVIAVIAWVAALLYLPRLMVYHAATAPGSEMSETFKVMERRLLNAIARPAMIAAWGFGIWMAILLHAWEFTWFWAKLVCVILLSLYHELAAGWVRAFAEDRNVRPVRFYRIVNEVPTVLMVAIVILVIVRPF